MSFADKESGSEYFDEDDDDASSITASLRTSRKRHSSFGWRRGLGAVLALFILALLSLGAVYHLRSSATLKDSQELFPHIGTRRVTFGLGKVYKDRTAVGDQAWESLMPIGRGNIAIANRQQYKDLGPGVPQRDPILQGYGITVFHQLHCLAMLRHALHTLQAGHGLDEQTPPPHLNHCLDYIRESLMCSGDTTIESPSRIEREGDHFVGGVDGSNVVHTCRDWDAIFGFAVEHRSGNHTGHKNTGKGHMQHGQTRE